MRIHKANESESILYTYAKRQSRQKTDNTERKMKKARGMPFTQAAHGIFI